MMKRLITVAILIAVLCTMADARMPQIGDYVGIIAGSSTTAMSYAGTITNIGNGLICISATEIGLAHEEMSELSEPKDVCIGIGSITGLGWPKVQVELGDIFSIDPQRL
jgi:hypothetical protein